MNGVLSKCPPKPRVSTVCIIECVLIVRGSVLNECIHGLPPMPTTGHTQWHAASECPELPQHWHADVGRKKDAHPRLK